jgi:ribulose-5-phosphate 4-epimerase/fuculose-1-phosphate aldolase
MDLNPEVTSRVDATKDEVIAAGRFLGSRRYHAALAGNISARVTEELIVCTRHGAGKEALEHDGLILCELTGRQFAGKGEPTSELSAAVTKRDIEA